MLLQEFRNWKGKWSLAGTHLMSRMRSCNPSSSIPCQERLGIWSVLSPAGSFDKAMEQLTAKFGYSFRLAASYIPATGGKAGTTKKQKFRAAAAVVGNLELVLPELEAEDITAKDFFVIHLGLSSLLAPAQRAWHLHNAQERRNHSVAHPATPFKLGMAASAAKLRAWCEVEAEKAEADKDLSLIHI